MIFFTIFGFAMALLSQIAVGQDATAAAAAATIADVGVIDVSNIDPTIWPWNCRKPYCLSKCQTLLIYPAKPCTCPKWECIPCPKVVKCPWPSKVQCQTCNDGSVAETYVVNTPCPQYQCKECSDCLGVSCLYGYEDFLVNGCKTCKKNPCNPCPEIWDCDCKQLNRDGCWQCIKCPCPLVACQCYVEDPETKCPKCIDPATILQCPVGQCSITDDVTKCPKCGPCPCPPIDKNCCDRVWDPRTNCTICKSWPRDCACGTIDGNPCSACKSCCGDPVDCPCNYWSVQDVLYDGQRTCPKCVGQDQFAEECKKRGCNLALDPKTRCYVCDCCKYPIDCKCFTVLSADGRCKECSDTLQVPCPDKCKVQFDENKCPYCNCTTACPPESQDLLDCIKKNGEGKPTPEGCRTCCNITCPCPSVNTIRDDNDCPIQCGKPCDRVVVVATAEQAEAADKLVG